MQTKHTRITVGRRLRTGLVTGSLALGVALIGTASSAAAADTPCRDDAKKLCGDVQPGEGRLQACLEARKDEASAACRMRMVEVKAELKRGEQACGDDALRFCADVEPGKGRVGKCLVEHESELTPDCKAWTDKTRAAVQETGDEIRGGVARVKAMNEACGADVGQFCADVRKGGGRLVKCLEENESKVSEGCRAAMQ